MRGRPGKPVAHARDPNPRREARDAKTAERGLWRSPPGTGYSPAPAPLGTDVTH